GRAAGRQLECAQFVASAPGQGAAVQGRTGGGVDPLDPGLNKEKQMTGVLLVFIVLALFVFWVVAKTAVVVPQQNAYVVERLGRFAGVLDAGFHILVPFV